jgi:single-stranded-DNA-specific exonuclease
VVEDFAKEGGTLLITVDCGISNADEVAYGNDLGIDTIITDHHNPPEELPAAVTIINPKIGDSGYPFRDLAGCGVVSKVIWALRFASTPVYNQEFCLLNLRPGNETIILEAVKLRNLVEIDRLTEHLVAGMVNLEETRIPAFFEGQEIFVYDAPLQKKYFSRVFGSSAELEAFDFAPELGKYYSNIAGKSLLRLRDQSRMIRYQEKLPEEIDVLKNAFFSLIHKQHPNLAEGFTGSLDLVALGTLADLMPLEDENRILVKQGMAVLNKTPRKGLRELLIKQNLLGKHLSTTDIGWQITPVLNAAGRLGVPQQAVKLLLSENPEELEALGEEVLNLNRERKRLGDNIWKTLLNRAEESFKEFDERFVLLGDSSINRGITGILAARLSRYFKVPAMAVAFLDDVNVGSVRSFGGVKVKGMLEKLSDLFLDFGGHDFAAGFSMPPGSYEQFLRRLPDAVKRLPVEKPPEEELIIDAELPLTYLKPALNDVVELFEPYGESNPPLQFLVKGIKIESMDVMGKTEQKHLKLLLDSGTHKWPAVYWSAAERAEKDFRVGDKVDIVFRLGRNYFQHKEILQLTILDMKR